jgi:predicted DCC family thiol-disulfide oxidoreductase YuxK
MTDAERIEITGRTLILFDGVCSLCNHTIRFLMNRDPGGALCFAPNRSRLALEFLARSGITPAPETVVLITNVLTSTERLYTRSDASIEALQHLRRPWPLLGRLLSFVPRFIRETGYSVIARYRYRLFGKYDTCPIPTQAQRSRILGM